MRTARYAMLCILVAAVALGGYMGTAPSLAQTTTESSNLPARVNRGTPGSWTVIARARHNEWNSNAFNPSGPLDEIPTSTETTGEDGLKQIYVALIGQLFTSLQEVVQSFVTGFQGLLLNMFTST